MLPAVLLLTSTLSIDTPIDCDVTANPLVHPTLAPPPLNLEGDNNSVWLRDAPWFIVEATGALAVVTCRSPRVQFAPVPDPGRRASPRAR